MNGRRDFTVVEQALDLAISDAFSEEAVVDISGTFVGTVVVEGSVDGTIFRALAMSPVAGGADVASVTAPGAWRVNFGGMKAGRVRCSAFTSGTIVAQAAVTRKAA